MTQKETIRQLVEGAEMAISFTTQDLAQPEPHWKVEDVRERLVACLQLWCIWQKLEDLLHDMDLYYQSLDENFREIFDRVERAHHAYGERRVSEKQMERLNEYACDIKTFIGRLTASPAQRTFDVEMDTTGGTALHDIIECAMLVGLSMEAFLEARIFDEQAAA